MLDRKVGTDAIQVNYGIILDTSCETVALYGSFSFSFFFADHRATVFTLETAQKKILRRFFANFCHEIGCENDQKYISFR